MRSDSPDTTFIDERHRRDAIADLCDRASRRFVLATRDHEDASGETNDMLTDALRTSLAEAFDEGRRQGIAEELGILAIAFRESADRYPWQVFCRDETCVLLTRDLRDQVVIASEVRAEDESFLRRPGSVPEALLCLVRRALLR
ncbi:MAG: hypothetical protein JNL80_01270 [Phycisphaerae bacterium]|jgi:hypothetical protein|nr:hypothetical protein [Phycisphaerae bacterium]